MSLRPAARRGARAGVDPGGYGHAMTRPSPVRLAVLTAVASVLMTVPACSSDNSGNRATDSRSTDSTIISTPPPGDYSPSRPVEFKTGDSAFSEVPDPIPTGHHGDLLRYQLVADPPEGLVWYRVMYLSETVTGAPTVVTGVVTVPDREPPEGGWRLATHAHGSTGWADDCAPSAGLDGDPLAAAELIVVGLNASQRDFVVASTDYEGQGGPGRHPFLVGESEGRSVLDAALAARKLPGLNLDEQVSIVGYSQGGHAALWAAQLAPTWTPQLSVIGTVAGAPASEVAGLLDVGTDRVAVVDNPNVVGFLGGLAATDPELAPALDEILTPGGQEVLRAMDASCTPPPGFAPDPPMVAADPRKVEPWATLMAANTAGTVAVNSPILVVHSAADAQVPIEHSQALLDRLCAQGQMIERQVLPEGDHVATAVSAYDQGFTWLVDLMSGSDPKSSCPPA